MEERLRKFEGDKTGEKQTEPEETSSRNGIAEGHGLTQDDTLPGSVDAMGTVSYADERDSAFFGVFQSLITSFLQLIRPCLKSHQREILDSLCVYLIKRALC